MLIHQLLLSVHTSGSSTESFAWTSTSSGNLLVQELIAATDFQQIFLNIQVIQVIQSIAEGLIDEQVHCGRACAHAHTHTLMKLCVELLL